MISKPFAKLIERNFEKFCVMEQRGFFTMKFEIPASVPPSLKLYADMLKAFNQDLDDHQSCQAAYTAGFEGRTRETALILDEKHEAVRERFIALKPWVMKVNETLERDRER